MRRMLIREFDKFIADIKLGTNFEHQAKKLYECDEFSNMFMCIETKKNLFNRAQDVVICILCFNKEKILEQFRDSFLLKEYSKDIQLPEFMNYLKSTINIRIFIDLILLYDLDPTFVDFSTKNFLLLDEMLKTSIQKLTKSFLSSLGYLDSIYINELLEISLFFVTVPLLNSYTLDNDHEFEYNRKHNCNKIKASSCIDSRVSANTRKEYLKKLYCDSNSIKERGHIKTVYDFNKSYKAGTNLKDVDGIRRNKIYYADGMLKLDKKVFNCNLSTLSCQNSKCTNPIIAIVKADTSYIISKSGNTGERRRRYELGNDTILSEFGKNEEHLGETCNINNVEKDIFSISKLMYKLHKCVTCHSEMSKHSLKLLFSYTYILNFQDDIQLSKRYIKMGSKYDLGLKSYLSKYLIFGLYNRDHKGLWQLAPVAIIELAHDLDGYNKKSENITVSNKTLKSILEKDDAYKSSIKKLLAVLNASLHRSILITQEDLYILIIANVVFCKTRDSHKENLDQKVLLSSPTSNLDDKKHNISNYNSHKLPEKINLNTLFKNTYCPGDKLCGIKDEEIKDSLKTEPIYGVNDSSEFNRLTIVTNDVVYVMRMIQNYSRDIKIFFSSKSYRRDYINYKHSICLIDINRSKKEKNENIDMLEYRIIVKEDHSDYVDLLNAYLPNETSKGCMLDNYSIRTCLKYLRYILLTDMTSKKNNQQVNVNKLFTLERNRLKGVVEPLKLLTRIEGLCRSICDILPDNLLSVKEIHKIIQETVY